MSTPTTLSHGVRIARQIARNLRDDLGPDWPFINAGHVPAVLQAIDAENDSALAALLPCAVVNCEKRSSEMVDLGDQPTYDQEYSVIVDVWAPWDPYAEGSAEAAMELGEAVADTFHMHFRLTDDAVLCEDSETPANQVFADWCRCDSGPTVEASDLRMRLMIMTVHGTVRLAAVPPIVPRPGS